MNTSLSAWVDLWLYALASLGLAFVVGFSKISLPFRVLLGGQLERTKVPGLGFPIAADAPITVQVNDQPPVIVAPAVKPLIPWAGPWMVALLECPGCFGFWTGVIAWAFRNELQLPFFLEPSHFFPGAVVFGLITCATNMLGARAIGLLS